METHTAILRRVMSDAQVGYHWSFAFVNWYIASDTPPSDNCLAPTISAKQRLTLRPIVPRLLANSVREPAVRTSNREIQDQVEC